MKVEVVHESNPKPPIKEVNITLTPDEAMKLAKLFGKLLFDGPAMEVSHYYANSRTAIEVGTRKLTDDIYSELVNNGFDYSQSISHIYFNERFSHCSCEQERHEED